MHMKLLILAMSNYMLHVELCINDIQPNIAIGSLTANSLNPNIFIKGIIKYESKAF